MTGDAQNEVIDARWIIEGVWLEITNAANLPWSDMQAVKDAYFGENVTCVEVYPAARDKVDNADVRHLWRQFNLAEWVG